MTGTPKHDTLMWEVQAAPGTLGELLEWVDTEALPSLRAQACCCGVDVYRSTEERAVVIAHFDGEPGSLSEPPSALVARPAHQWPFQRVR